MPSKKDWDFLHTGIGKFPVLTIIITRHHHYVYPASSLCLPVYLFTYLPIYPNLGFYLVLFYYFIILNKGSFKMSASLSLGDDSLPAGPNGTLIATPPNGELFFFFSLCLGFSFMCVMETVFPAMVCVVCALCVSIAAVFGLSHPLSLRVAHHFFIFLLFSSNPRFPLSFPSCLRPQMTRRVLATHVPCTFPLRPASHTVSLGY